MNGWPLAAVVAGAFGVGYLTRFVVCVHACSERQIRLYRHLLAAELKTKKQAEYIDHLENIHAVVDEDPNLAADQAEQYLRERGGS